MSTLQMKFKMLYLLILGSCFTLNLSYAGCCQPSLSRTCRNKDCYCDQHCHSINDCCRDIADIGCHPYFLKGKTK